MMNIPEEHLFQVYMDTELFRKRLQLTKKFSKAITQEKLLNCANLVNVILGISKPNYYLNACTARGKGTDFDESRDDIVDALSRCGIQARVEHTSYQLTGLNFFNYFNTNLRNDHATFLSVKWKTENYSHAVVLWRDYRGIFHYVDPQVTNPDGSYPLQIYDKEVIKYLKEKVETFRVYISDREITIGKDESKSAKCITDVSPMWLNDPESIPAIFSLGKKAIETHRTKLLKATMKKIAKKSRKSKMIGTKKAKAIGSLASKRLAKNKLTRRAQRSIAALESKLKLTKRLNTKKTTAKRPRPATK